MVVDAGGGTVDITVHRNRSEGGLVELHSPSGGAWGSFYINKEFEKLLEELLGAEMKNTSAWFQIMDIFEVCDPTSCANMQIWKSKEWTK
jgi:hypothetical protein